MSPSLHRFKVAALVCAALSCERSSPATSTEPVATAGDRSVNGAGGSTNETARPEAGSAGANSTATSGGRSGEPSSEPRAGASGISGTGPSAAGKGGSAPPDVPAMSDAGPFFPAAGATDVCPDPPLRFHFAAPPKVGNAGKIRVFDANSNMPVASIDLAATTVNESIGGAMFKLPRPVHVAGSDVIVRLPARALDYGHTYYVTVDADALERADGSSVTIDDPMTWRFSTAAAAPSDRTDLRVAIDGTGQFCSAQGALDAATARTGGATTITIENGTYFEVIRATGKNKLTLRGRDRKQTIITGVNNNTLNPNTATRSLVGIDASSDVVIENLTIHNLTPQGGSQAEALRLQNCDRCVVRRADIISLQDTLLWSGRIYAQDCYIEGNVDFVWGYGSAYFERCEIKTVGRAGYVVQARNEATKSGYVFVDSKITAGPGITGVILGRIDVSAYPGSQVAYINCSMGDHIAPSGWLITGGAAGSGLRFAEYRSTDATGSPLDVTRRLAGSKQLSTEEAARLRDPAQVLAGWAPPK